MNRVIEKIKEFEGVMRKHSDFGAFDSEPWYLYKHMLKKAFKLGSYKIPATADGWQLYSMMEGSDDAARELCDEFSKLALFIKESNYAEAYEAGKYYFLVEWE